MGGDLKEPSPRGPLGAGRNRGRLSVFEHAHEDGGLAAEAKVQLPAGQGPGELQGHLHKSSLMQNIAQSFSALEESEKRHSEAIMLEEEHSRKRYIAQFQSLARKIDNLYEEARASQQFREETTEVNYFSGVCLATESYVSFLVLLLLLSEMLKWTVTNACVAS